MSEQGKKKAVAPVLQNMQDYISNHYMDTTSSMASILNHLPSIQIISAQMILLSSAGVSSPPYMKRMLISEI